MKIELDLTGVTEEKSGQDVFTEGIHLFKIVDADIRDNKAKTGNYLMLTMVAVEGVDAGKTIVDYINFINANEDTVRQALARIKKIQIETGGNPKRLSDTDELLGKQIACQIINKEEKWTKDNGDVVDAVKSNIYKIKDLANYSPMDAAPVVAEKAPANKAAKATPESLFGKNTAPAPVAEPPVIADPAPVAAPKVNKKPWER